MAHTCSSFSCKNIFSSHEQLSNRSKLFCTDTREYPKNFSIKTYKGTQVKACQMERLASRGLSREDERAKISLNKNDNNKNEASLAVYSNYG